MFLKKNHFKTSTIALACSFALTLVSCKPKSKDDSGSDDATVSASPYPSGSSLPSSSNLPVEECITYERHITPVLNRYCVSCHNVGGRPPNLSTYESIIAASAGSTVIAQAIASIESRRMPPNQPANVSNSIVDPNDLEWLKDFQTNPRRSQADCPIPQTSGGMNTTSPYPSNFTATGNYGTNQDEAYANALATVLKSRNVNYLGTSPATGVVFNGQAPHGEVQELLTPTDIRVEGTTGKVWVKHNYVGFPANSSNSKKISLVTGNRSRYRDAVTVIFQRERGYHPETQDLFWVKYDSNGNVMKDPSQRPLAGKIGSSSEQSTCIGCHRASCGADFICETE